MTGQQPPPYLDRKLSERCTRAGCDQPPADGHLLCDAHRASTDTRAFLAHLPAAKVGTTGYCMGGRMSLTAAGTYPERIVAAAAYHPGNIATDAPDSPHLLAAAMRARVYIGGASDDPTFPDEQKQRLAGALTAARIDHTIETYPAKHGWVPSDTPVHDPAAAARHFETLIALLRSTLAA